MIQLPTSTFPSRFGGNNGLFGVSDSAQGSYSAPALREDTEVLYYSADRTGR
jgi:hypothetical protein